MTGQQTLFARVAVGLVAGCASILLASSERLRSLPKRRFDRTVFWAFAVSRLGLFAVVFLVLGIAPRGDVPAYYFAQARQVLQHLLPYRDFESSYAPLHPYLGAALISIWHSPLAIMLFSVLVELLLLPLWIQAGREFLREGELRPAALLYLASPISLQFAAIDGQDNVVIAVLIALAVSLVLRSRVVAAGAALGTSVAVVKFLPLLYAPAFLAAMPRRWRLVLGVVVVCGIVYGGFATMHAPILQPLAAEGDLRSAGDLPYVVETIFGVTLPARLSDGCLLLVLMAIFAGIGRAAYHAPTAVRLRALTFGMAAATLALLLLSKKSWPPYLMLALFPVCLLVWREGASPFVNGLRVVWFALFSLVGVAEHSYWSSVFLQSSSLEFHRELFSGHRQVWLLLSIEILLVGSYSWLLVEAGQRIWSETGCVPEATQR